jgi:elongation factor P--(R)-beta-lysine ligase
MSHAQKNNWQPTADIKTLKQRADILKRIRAFFYARNIMEVETPLMCRTSVTDPFIESIPAFYQSHPSHAPECFYLQTSPEYAMKRLLADGSGCIFQLCKAFRQGEIGRLHNPEFTMLEWYRVGFNQMQLIDEVDALLQEIIACAPAERMTYRDIFLRKFDIDVFTAPLHQLKTIAINNDIHVHDEITDQDTWLNLLMTHCIEPELGRDKPCVIYNFPASQAALARINADDPHTAARFEVYFQGMELANGFHELQDAEEQRKRFVANNIKRQSLHQTTMPIDELFLSALTIGLPDCSGVALGVDRLVMLALGKQTLPDVTSFPIECV